MKLLMVSRRFPPDVRSGSETVFAALFGQASVRHKVELVTGFVKDRSLLPVGAIAVDLRHTPKGVRHARVWQAARSAAKNNPPEVVLSNAIEVGETDCPVVCIVHDLNFGGTASWFRKQLYGFRAHRLAAIVVPSEATKRTLMGIGVALHRIHVIHNGVDLKRFHPIQAQAGPLVRLCYPSRILQGKGQHVAIDAVGRLNSVERKRVQLDIVGAVVDPLYLDQLRAQAFKLPVSFHTDVYDIAPHYQRADLVLFPTLMPEGFGFTAVEAMASGRPVVWSEQPAIREATGGIGFPVAADNAEALRDQIRAYLRDPGPFEEAGRQGRSYVEAHYSWERCWEGYESVLNQVRSS